MKNPMFQCTDVYRCYMYVCMYFKTFRFFKNEEVSFASGFLISWLVKKRNIDCNRALRLGGRDPGSILATCLGDGLESFGRLQVCKGKLSEPLHVSVRNNIYIDTYD